MGAESPESIKQEVPQQQEGKEQQETEKKGPEPTQEESDKAEIDGTTEDITDRMTKIIEENPDLATPEKLDKLAKLVTGKTIDTANKDGFNLTPEQKASINGLVQKFITNVIREQGLTKEQKDKANKIYIAITEKAVQIAKSDPEEAAKRGGLSGILPKVAEIIIAKAGDSLNPQQIAVIRGNLEDLIKDIKETANIAKEKQKT